MEESAETNDANVGDDSKNYEQYDENNCDDDDDDDDDGKNLNKETTARFLILNNKKNSMFLILQLIIYRQQASTVTSQNNINYKSTAETKKRFSILLNSLFVFVFTIIYFISDKKQILIRLLHMK